LWCWSSPSCCMPMVVHHDAWPRVSDPDHPSPPSPGALRACEALSSLSRTLHRHPLPRPSSLPLYLAVVSPPAYLGLSCHPSQAVTNLHSKGSHTVPAGAAPLFHHGKNRIPSLVGWRLVRSAIEQLFPHPVTPPVDRTRRRPPRLLQAYSVRL
jgi:hypothetical protein